MEFPDDASQRIAEALAIAQRGDLARAARLLAALSRERPRDAVPPLLLATLLLQLGDRDGALRAVDIAAALAPNDAHAALLRTRLLIAAERYADAETSARHAVTLSPDDAAAAFELAHAISARQRWDDADEVLSALLARWPLQAPARRLRARCRVMGGEIEAALEDALHPALIADAELGLALATDFSARHARDAHLRLLRALAARHPSNFACAIALATALPGDDRCGEALIWAERALALRPGDAAALQLRAIGLIDRGEAREGLAIYRDLVRRGMLGALDEQRYLIVSHYDPAPDLAQTYADHLGWSARHARPFGSPFDAPERGNGALRIGWLSPRFSEGPVARFFTGLLRDFDRATHRHVLISLSAHSDATTLRLRDLADETLDVQGLDDAALLQRLREARLDVLVDLAGHAPFSRPAVLAQRVAPLQLCWLDYFDTTGLPNMDGWIGDPWLTPTDSPQRFRERVMNLPGGRFCYTPPEGEFSPERRGGGAPVFVSFNRIAKLHNGVIAAWSRILERVPEARLRLGARALDDAYARDHLVQRFAGHGIAPERLRLHGAQPYADVLAAYRESDIALDPFPFSGCTTSCDALWMGLPVVTLPGESVVSRQSASLLWRLERREWVAGDLDAYVETAVAMARDVDPIRKNRAALRCAVVQRLCDSRRQADEFATLFGAALARGPA